MGGRKKTVRFALSSLCLVDGIDIIIGNDVKFIKIFSVSSVRLAHHLTWFVETAESTNHKNCLAIIQYNVRGQWKRHFMKLNHLISNW